MTFAGFNTCSNDDESRRLKHCRLSFFAIFATFRVGSADQQMREPGWDRSAVEGARPSGGHRRGQTPGKAFSMLSASFKLRSPEAESDESDRGK
jgi:hypothetical protein